MHSGGTLNLHHKAVGLPIPGNPLSNEQLAWSRAHCNMLSPRLKGEPWEMLAERRGDDRRDFALLRTRRSDGYPLSELGTCIGVSYAAVAQAITKAEQRIAHPDYLP